MLDCACAASRSSEHCALLLRRYPPGGVKSFSKSLLTADSAIAEGLLREYCDKLDKDPSFVLIAAEARQPNLSVVTDSGVTLALRNPCLGSPNFSMQVT